MKTLQLSAVTVPTVRKINFSPVVLVLAAILLVLIIPPAAYLVASSLYTTNFDGSFDQFTFEFFADLLRNPYFLRSLMHTAVYSLGSACVGIVLGTVLAIIVERTNTPGRKYAFLGAVISLAIPHVLYTVAWLMILGKSGPFNQMLKAIFGATAPSFDVYSLPGMILIEGVGFVPLTFLMMSAVLRSTDAAFEEASMMSGAGPVTTFWKITLRMGMPGVLALLLLSFIRAFESFEVPAIVGLAGNIEVLSTSIYQSSRATTPPNFGQAGAYSVCLLAFLACLLYFYGRLSRHAHRYQTITGKGYRPRVIDLGRGRYASMLVLIAILLFVIGLPLAIIVFVSFKPFFGSFNVASLSRWTLKNYATVIGPGFFRSTLVNTLVLGTVTASIVVPFTALCAWLAVRRKPAAWVLDQLATAPLTFPSIVMGVAFLQVFVNLPFPFYGTLTSVIVASAVAYLPYGMRYAYAGVLQIHSDLEEASTASGAPQMQTFLRIVLPLLSASMISCWLFVFLLAVRAMSLPLLLVGPGSSLVAVSLFDLWQNGQVTELAAMGTVWVALMTCVSGCFYLVARRFRILTA
ncbi:ABC transporter permease [Sinorhizobium terangae]|uniref:ABC transporter permease subunit n=1 Tax=Sinorhizobium terangae TaxID=110322 RepID=A0A6N7LJA3_SINTE|nr:iron ABC transporter permease [Sinorhizobium terangae]MBB4189472.1 iron(III) transport system permease protein [Sinorhizobium terangae]MQX16925.1 ABC transporter permease subunit [Sinorhizobium terangae]WFU49059.1 iron ABC transporter permease [Sinorhizobium terangae]